VRAALASKTKKGLINNHHFIMLVPAIAISFAGKCASLPAGHHWWIIASLIMHVKR